MSKTVEARVTPPDLEDSTRYVKIENVPILDPHVRNRVIDGIDPNTGKPTKEIEETYVDDKQLQVIVDNTNDRADAGNLPLVLIGHTRKDSPETDQPPLAGFMKDLKVGSFNGEPTILADLYMEREVEIDKDGATYVKEYGEILKQYPRRSVEIFFKTEPYAFIDALALLRRTPFRPLGLVTYNKETHAEIYECECNHEKGAEMAEENEGMGGGSGGEGGGGNMDEQVAIEKMTEALAVKMAAHDGLHGAMASKIVPQVVQQVMSQIGSKLAEEMSRGIAQLKEHIGSLLEEHAEDPEAEDEEKPVVDGNPDGNEEGAATTESKAPEAGLMEDEKKDEAPPATPEAEEPEKNDMASTSVASPSGTNTFVPDAEAEKMADQRLAIEVGVLREDNKTLTAKNDALMRRLETIEQYQAEQVAATRTNLRRATLETMANDGYEIDVNDQMETYGHLDDDHFNKHVSMLGKVARRSLANGGRPALRMAPIDDLTGESEGAELMAHEGEAIEMYAKDHRADCTQKPGEDAVRYGMRVVEQYKSLDKAVRAKYANKAAKIVAARQQHAQAAI